MNANEVSTVLGEASRRSERIVRLAALLSTEISSPVIVVGGSAIQVYTEDSYVSGDVDLVGDRPKLISALERWEFERSGRLWAMPTLELWIDPVGAEYRGDAARVKEVDTPFGPPRLAPVEDLVGKRLNEAKVWPGSSKAAMAQAVIPAAEFERQMDWAYVTKVASREDAADLVPELRRRLALIGGRKPPKPTS